MSLSASFRSVDAERLALAESSRPRVPVRGTMLHGRARATQAKATIKRLWKPIMKTWFTQGEDDPRITAIAVEPVSGYYWDNKHGDMVAGVKMAVGAAIGKTLDDSIEGELRF